MGAAPDPLLCTLPAGRHGLPRDFVEANHKQRILNGFARAICENGYLGCTIADVTKSARISRRTFYDYFESKEQAAAALVEFGSGFEAPALDTGLGVLTVELVAVALVGNVKDALVSARMAAGQVEELGNALEGRG